MPENTDDLVSNSAAIPASQWELDHKSKLLYGMWLIVLVGVLWRVIRYLACYPIWGDEAMFALNLLDADFVSITKRLDQCQIAPVLFLWGELASLRMFGPSEYSLRLIPFVAGLCSLPLFARLAWLTLSPYARVVAIGILAVSIWPVTMGANVKPYSLDLLAALLLIVPAVQWLQQSTQESARTRWLVTLIVVLPIAMLSSYPAVFVAGGISLALIVRVWKTKDAKNYALFAVFNLLMVSIFIGHYLLVARNQLASPVSGITTEAGMVSYWDETFPPANPLAFVKWFAITHVGEIMSYPVGESNGGSIITFVLFVSGIVALWKLRRHELLILFLAPFAIALVAAGLRKYPYGACRLSQFLAPAIIILSGAGASYLFHNIWKQSRSRMRAASALVLLLMAVGIGGMSWHLVQPWKEKKDAWIRDMANLALDDDPASNSIVIFNKQPGPDAVLVWYLRCRADHCVWMDDETDVAQLVQLDPPRDWTMVHMDILDISEPPPVGYPTSISGDWKRKEIFRFSHPSERGKNQMMHCVISKWRR